MQALLFSRLVELKPCISFPCSVGGKMLTATLTHKEATGLQMLYHVTFSDGQKDSYVAGEVAVREGFGRTRTPDEYEDSVFDDLCVVRHFERGFPYFNFRVREEGVESFNVWIREKAGHYSVYYKGQYQFTLRKRAGWESSTMREKGYLVNGRLAKLLADYLDEHALKQSRKLRRA